MKKLYLFILLIFFSCTKISKEIILGTISDSAMVSSAHPIASQVGIDVLKQGGNAFDAAIAVKFALSVVHPSAGNIGGGGFLVYRENNGNVGTLDFREKAPISATKNMYLKENEKYKIELNNEEDEYIVDGKKSREGLLSSGVPGTVDGMVKIHEKFSLLSWESLIQPAINLANHGVVLTKREAEGLNKTRKKFEEFNASDISFLKSNNWNKGDTLIQKNLAKTLDLIKRNKRDGFYSGSVAKLIMDEMNSGNGIITLEDLNKYVSIWRDPIIGNYKNYKIISMGPPSSGGIALTQLLKATEAFPISDWGFNSLKTINLMTEIESRVYADRATYLGDPDYYNVPNEILISDQYINNRFKIIKPEIKTTSENIKEGEMILNESDETTHFSIVDKFGNAVAITTTLNGSYGSKVVVSGAGFLLNNEMDDFSIKPGFPNMYGLIGGEANSIESGKRMLSSMAPTIVEKNNNLFMILGTPGGSAIITSVYQNILNVIEHGMTMQESVNSKRFHHQWLPDVLIYEDGAIDNDTKNKLKSIGHKLVKRNPIGRMDCIMVREDGKLEGAADITRGDNIAIGY